MFSEYVFQAPSLAILVAIVALGILSVAYAIARAYSKEIIDSDHLRISWVGRARSEIFQPIGLEKARMLAEQRREKIRVFLSEYRLDSERPLGSTDSLPSSEFLELPREFEGYNRYNHELDRDAAVAQVVRLRSQLKSDALLLAERAVDLIAVLLNKVADRGSFRDGQFRRSDVPLIRLGWKGGHVDELTRWRITLETDSDILGEMLAEHRYWLGLGVDLVPSDNPT
jgi:hypothetical protein